MSLKLFDCSSFTQFDLKPGDLVMSRVGSGKGIGHVGIYMGNQKMIHNVNPTADVVISDLRAFAY